MYIYIYTHIYIYYMYVYIYIYIYVSLIYHMTYLKLCKVLVYEALSTRTHADRRAKGAPRGTR
jgi:hypothetical protein